MKRYIGNLTRAALCAWLCYAAMPALALTLNVDTTVDDPALSACDDSTPRDCSLRGAVIRANSTAEPSAINVPAGTYVLERTSACSFRDAVAGSFQIATTSLCLTGSITVKGAGAGTTIIDGNQPLGVSGATAPVLFISSGARVEVDAVSLIRGNFSAASLAGYGGAIRNAGSLRMVKSAISDSVTISYGGAIYNTGSVALFDTLVARNSADLGGGGIANFSPNAYLEVSGTLIRDNFAGGHGGGIFNFAGTVVATGSTIASNSAQGSGGGLYNGTSNLAFMTNSTVSGNHARTGGGILNEQASATLHLNNVTIADNIARWPDDPSRGIGGGIMNNDLGIVTLSNTLVARNLAAEIDAASGTVLGPDCFAIAPRSAGLVSKGYNLIGDPSRCDIVGDTTGNIVGRDPLLGALADNGGPTPTHAPAKDSPVVDAGHPAPPGSGGTACAIDDQRRLLRALGSACDIGALERSAAFTLDKVVPNAGGDSGTVSLLLVGSAFESGSTVVLRRAGYADIAAVASATDVGGLDIAATFDLRGRPSGAWDVVVVNPDAETRTLPAGFTVRSGGGPELWVDAVGAIRGHGHPNVVTILYGNRGNTDAVGVPLSLSIPQGYGARRYFEMTPPPRQSAHAQPNWFFVPPIIADSQQSALQLPLLLPIIPAGFTGTLRVELTFPENGRDSELIVVMGEPLFTGGIDPSFVANGVVGAGAYVRQNFGLTVPGTLVPELQQYFTAQLQQVVANGRAAFVTTLGAAPQVYSTAQMQLDLAWFAALRVTGNAPPFAH